MPEPIPVLPLEYAPAATLRRPRWRRIVRAMIPLLWLGFLAAWVCIPSVHVETVLVTGPLLLGGGVVMLIGAILIRESRPALLALAHCAVCLLFVALVLVFHWSPHDAKVPFTVMGFIYVVASMPWSVRAWRGLGSGRL
jgi:hypothetical protein